MAHIDDHTIELFILGAPEVADRKEEIAAHIAECAGCRNLAEKIKGFYLEAERELDRNPVPLNSPEKAVVLRKSDVASIYEPIKGITSRRRPTTIQRLRQFAWQHPIATGAGSFAFLTGIAVLLVAVVNRDSKDASLAYLHPNVGQGMFEAYNKENEKRWSIPARSLESLVGQERDRNTKLTEIADLDGDGKKEVVTSVDLIMGRDQGERPLRVLDAKGKLVWEKNLGHSVTFRGTKYSSTYKPEAIVVDDFSGSGRPEIIVCATSLRSPCAIYRLSAAGDILGEYWHFGLLLGLYSIDLDGDGKKEIVACGTNDMADVSGGAGASNAVIVVLDREKIVGNSESEHTKGFGFPKSDAELCYIQLPRSDIHELLGVSVEAHRLDLESDGSLTFATNTGATEQLVTFYFNFSRGCRPMWVKSDDITEHLHSQLASEGRLRSKWGPKYLENLRSRVQVFKLTERPLSVLR